MKPVVFLDIDGVLHIAKSGPMLALKTECVQALNWLTDASDAQIVISSSWRFMKDCNTRLLDGGVKAKIIGATPRMKSATRGAEIALWLGCHAARPFVILDDEADMGGLSEHLVQTSWGEGLTLPLVEIALTHLCKVGPDGRVYR